MREDDFPRYLAVNAHRPHFLDDGVACAFQHGCYDFTIQSSDTILFSGGAPGAERHGIEEVNFTFDGHKIARHRGVHVLNHEELQSGDVSLEYIALLMHRRYTDSPTIRKVLQTMWCQINNGQKIYVIGTILEDKTVRGGTG